MDKTIKKFLENLSDHNLASFQKSIISVIIQYFVYYYTKFIQKLVDAFLFIDNPDTIWDIM